MRLINGAGALGVLGDVAYGEGQGGGLGVGQGALKENTATLTIFNRNENKTTNISLELNLDKINPKIRYIAKLYPSAYAASQKSGLSLELMLAQGAQETGWGESVLSGTNNMFNIKKGVDWNGPVKVVTGALEYDKNGATYYERSEFRVYKNIEASVQDRIDFLSKNKRYKELFSSNIKGSTVKEAHVLQKAHYAGNNQSYASTLIQVATGPTMKNALNFARKYYGY